MTRVNPDRNIFSTKCGTGIPLFGPLLLTNFEQVETLPFNLKGVFAKNERGYRLNAIKKRF